MPIEFYIILVGMLALVIILGFIFIWNMFHRANRERELERTNEQLRKHIRDLKKANHRLRRQDRLGLFPEEY